MNLSSVQFGLALNLLMRTLPILLIRFGANLLFWIVAIVYLLIVGFVSSLIGQAIDWLGVLIFVIALISVIPFYNLAYRYVFYMIKAAHVAVMAEMLANNNLPAGTNQLEWGRKRVQERFVEVNAMFVIDELVSGVVHAFTGTVYSIASWLPGDTIRTLAQIINRVIEYSLNYIDEAVFARSFWNPQQNVWENARDGVVLYAMSWRTMLMTAVVLMLVSFIPALVVLLIFGAPIGLLLSQISPQFAGWSIILVLFLSWLTKVAIGDTFAIAAILATYQRTTTGMQPDAAMSDKLDSISEQFRDLKNRASEALSGNRGTAPVQ